MIKYFLGFIFLLGLIYIILPGPTKIEDFPPLIPSLKSDLEGDTIQNPNIAAYFSDFQRAEITNFYRFELAKKYFFGLIIPPLKINHPPELAYTYIRDQQESTFLEEYVYPLRESLFVNGYEPTVENAMFNKPSDFVGNHIWYKNEPFYSKTTIRFYPSPLWPRILVYLGIWVAGLILYKLILKIIK